MDVQFYGGNCFLLANKTIRLVVDDNLQKLGLKSITKPGDIALFTSKPESVNPELKLTIDIPGNYEVGGLSIIGVSARAHIDPEGEHSATMYKIQTADASYLFVGNIYPDLSDEQLEDIGMVDVMFVPVGGNGYTLDGVGAMHVIRQIEPKLVIPSHFAEKGINYEVPQQSLEDAMKNISLEVKETLPKLRLKPNELGEVTQLTILERS